MGRYVGRYEEGHVGRYEEGQAQERRDMPIVKRWLESKLPIYETQDTSPRQQKEDDIDFTGRKLNGEVVTFEAKIRYKLYNDILIETVSNTTTGSPGWIYVSKADCLIYVFLIDDKVQKGFIIKMPDLREWWKTTGFYKEYPKRYGKTGSLYRTENRVVPEKDIPSNIIIYHPTYGLMNPITEELDSSYLR